MTIDEDAKKLREEIDEVLTCRWAVGFKDRGTGHGDFGVMVEDFSALVVECSNFKIAEHIVEIHNKNLTVPKEDENMETNNEFK